MRLQKRRSDKFACWAFLMPTLIFLAVTALFPLLYSVYLSFFRLKLNLPNQTPVFVGLANYAKMFTDKMLHTSTINTLVFAFISVALEVVLGLMIAMVICSDSMWSRVATSIFMIPMIMAPVAIGTLWRMMMDASTGVLNYFLSFFGVDKIQWLADPFMAKISVCRAANNRCSRWVAR